MKILRNSLLLVILAGVTWMLFQLFGQFDGITSLNRIAGFYATNAPAETGAANLVTSIVVTYRGLDTLGEVTILFLTAAIIGLLMKSEKTASSGPKRKNSEFLITGSRILIPVIALIGIYIFMNGHLTPGGGFQGGAVLASAFILLLIGFASANKAHKLLEITESISGFAFIVIGVLGIVLAGGFLDTTFLSLGKFGSLFSAGAIPLIYSFIGLKVGAELATIILEIGHPKEETSNEMNA